MPWQSGSPANPGIHRQTTASTCPAVSCRISDAVVIASGTGGNFGIQYALPEARRGAGICGLGANRTAVALFAGDRKWLRKMGLFFLPVVGPVCYAAWSGYSFLFALVMLVR